MALLNTYSNSTNMITETALDVQFSSSVAYKDTTLTVMEVRRVATKKYRYVGMSLSAANTCKEDKVAQYYRKFASYEMDGATIIPHFNFGCTASIAVTNQNGSNFDVEIDVKEEDTIYTTSAADTVDECRNLFRFAELRNYDETNPALTGIAISQASYDVSSEYIKILFQQNIANFDSTKLTIEYWNQTTSAWVAIPKVKTIVDGNKVSAASISRPLWRLRYSPGGSAEDVLSNEAVPVDDPYEEMIVVDSCTLNVLQSQLGINYTDKTGWSYTSETVTLEYYDAANDEWTSYESYLVTADGYMIVTPHDQNSVTTYRVKIQRNQAYYYSRQFAVTKGSASDYSLTVNSANIDYDDDGNLALTATFTSSIRITNLQSSNFKALITCASGATPKTRAATPVSLIQTGAKTFTAKFINGTGGARFTYAEDDNTLTLAFGPTLDYGIYLVNSASFDVTCTEYVLDVASAEQIHSTRGNALLRVTLASTATVPNVAQKKITVKYRDSSSSTTYNTGLVLSAWDKVLLVSQSPTASSISAGQLVSLAFGPASTEEETTVTTSSDVPTITITSAEHDVLADNVVRVYFTSSGIPKVEAANLHLDYCTDAMSASYVDEDAGYALFEADFSSATASSDLALEYYDDVTVVDVFISNDIAPTRTIILDYVRVYPSADDTETLAELHVAATLPDAATSSDIIVSNGSTSPVTPSQGSSLTIMALGGHTILCGGATADYYYAIGKGSVASNSVKSTGEGATVKFIATDLDADDTNISVTLDEDIPDFDYEDVTLEITDESGSTSTLVPLDRVGNVINFSTVSGMKLAENKYEIYYSISVTSHAYKATWSKSGNTIWG